MDAPMRPASVSPVPARESDCRRGQAAGRGEKCGVLLGGGTGRGKGTPVTAGVAIPAAPAAVCAVAGTKRWGLAGVLGRAAVVVADAAEAGVVGGRRASALLGPLLRALAA